MRLLNFDFPIHFTLALHKALKAKSYIFIALIFPMQQAYPQCVPPQPQNLQVSVNSITGDVTVQWRVPCPSPCNNSANTSILFFIGFYSQQSAAPNALDAEYGFNTFVDVGCYFTELWDGQHRDSSSTAEAKESECISTLMGQEINPFLPGFERSFSLQDICNNTYGYGAGVMQNTFQSYLFCSGVTYDVKVWSIEVNVRPNGSITSQSIACNDLYLDESNPAVLTSAFTYPGFISPIASPRIIISNSENSDGVYFGVNNRIIIDCTDTFSFEYQVTPGCNFTESVAAYFHISPTYTYAQGVYNPWDWGLNVDDWYIFFANNIVDGSTGQPIPYVGNNYFAAFTVADDMEVCILTQDPCNGSSGKTCIQFDAVDLDTVIADFSHNLTWTNSCDSFLVEFINNTTGAIDYYWDFGDGSFSTDSALTHLFVGGGPFEVTLAAIHTGWCGNNDTVSKTISFSPVYDTSAVSFSYTSAYTATCDSLTVQFTGQLSGSASLLWDFGNGQTSASLHPVAVYTTPGTYPVTVITQPFHRCVLSDTMTELVTFTPLNNDAVADFAYQIDWTNHCDSFRVRFINLSTNATAYYWDFGDGAVSTDPSLTHLFTAGGPFMVMLAAYHGGTCGRNDTTYQTLLFTPVFDTLDVSFSYTSAYSPNCDSLLVHFSGWSSAADAAYYWDFGNGQTSALQSPTAVYSAFGTYNVQLAVTPVNNTCLRGNDTSQPVIFSPFSYNSIADFSYEILYSNDCDTFIVGFTNLSTGGTSYHWDFGNGAASSDTNAIITYSAGNYEVMLQVNDSRNCSKNDTTRQPLTFTPVFTNPVAAFDFQVETDCDLSELTFTNLSSGTNRFIWRINGSIVSSDLAPNAPFLYYQPDTISVELTARGANNCAADDTVSKSIIIPAPYGYPVAAFDYTPLHPRVDELISFINLSLRADTTFYLWNFGDGTYSSAVHPQHAYSQQGEYKICLTADNGYGCPDSTCKDIPIIVTALVDLPTAFTPNGDNHNDIFIVRGKDIVKMRLRIFNRWGELVFESRDPAVGWDGTYKGEPQEMEVYDWLLNATLKNGQEIFRKGNVTLLR